MVEQRWLADLEAARDELPGYGDHIAAYGLGWLRSERALPELRRRLVADRHWEFLEWGEPDDPADRFGDYQFPHHFAFAGAIEHITERPWREVVKLTGAERRRLRLDSRGCDGAFAAHWLLHELDGAPLPSWRANTAWRHRCEPTWPGPVVFAQERLEPDREAAAEVEVLAAVEGPRAVGGLGRLKTHLVAEVGNHEQVGQRATSTPTDVSTRKPFGSPRATTWFGAGAGTEIIE